MPDYVALLRGVNVGGAKRVPMAEFRDLLARLGYTNPVTLLNSGNAVFTAKRQAPAAQAAAIRRAIAERLAIEVPVIVKSAEEFATIIAGNPFASKAFDPSRMVVAFVQDAGALPSLAGIKPLVARGESFAVGTLAAYLHCPDGLLQSKAGEALLGKAGAATTTRNWATTLKLQALLDGRGR